MSHLISIELEKETAERILGLLEQMPEPPLDQDEEDAYELKTAIKAALESDDG